MPAIDPRLAAALEIQLGDWRSALRDGAARTGWKLGIGSRERIGGELAVGHLTSATQLEPGARYRAAGAERLCADAEIALELGRDIDPDAGLGSIRDAIAGFGPALELVDLGGPPDDAEAVVAANVFHRAFVLGPSRPALPDGGVEARLLVNGEIRASAKAPDDFADKLRAAARVLAAVGERLRAGDRIITGSVVQVDVEAGDDVVADFGRLGRLRLAITP